MNRILSLLLSVYVISCVSALPKRKDPGGREPGCKKGYFFDRKKLRCTPRGGSTPSDTCYEPKDRNGNFKNGVCDDSMEAFDHEKKKCVRLAVPPKYGDDNGCGENQWFVITSNGKAVCKDYECDKDMLPSKGGCKVNHDKRCRHGMLLKMSPFGVVSFDCKEGFRYVKKVDRCYKISDDKCPREHILKSFEGENLCFPCDGQCCVDDDKGLRKAHGPESCADLALMHPNGDRGCSKNHYFGKFCRLSCGHCPAAKKPAPKPTKPAQKPTKPAQKPTKPAPKPAKPAKKPTKPAKKPTKPAQKPTKPAQKPTKPAVKPTKPAVKPTKPAQKPTKPAQ